MINWDEITNQLFQIRISADSNGDHYFPYNSNIDIMLFICINKINEYCYTKSIQ